VLVSRYVNSAYEVSAINSFLLEADANVRVVLLGRMTPIVRVLLWLVGTGSAVYFLLRPQGRRQHRPTACDGP
jgi:hypothetical protein